MDIRTENYIHDLAGGTAMLTQAVGILQGTRWDGNADQARQYLISMDMDLNFAAGLVADMDADYFAKTIQDLAHGGAARTGYKSVAIWVRKFGYDATLTASGDVWEIRYCPATAPGGPVYCGTCTLWEDELCNYPESGAYMTVRMSNDMACANYSPRHRYGWGIAGIIAAVVAAMVFLGVWIFTGDIWAAILLFEVAFEIILIIAEVLGEVFG